MYRLLHATPDTKKHNHVAKTMAGQQCRGHHAMVATFEPRQFAAMLCPSALVCLKG